MALKRTVTQREFSFPAIRFDAPTLLSFSGCMHAHAKCPPVVPPVSTKLSHKMKRPHPSSKNPHFQNEAKRTSFIVKMSFICMRMKNHFYMKG